MKQAGIITHYDVHNHGALLQLTALIKVLATKGIEAKALQFDKNYDFLGHKLKAKYDISLKSFKIYMKYLAEKGAGHTIYNYKKYRTLGKYKTANRLLGDYYSESDALDAVIVGSDEVFALHTGPTPVFFGHCLPSDTVVSYAGSFGPTTYDDICRLHAEAFVRSGIEAMKGVTVRDGNSADVVERLTGNRPPVVVDPVLLYGYKDEIKDLAAPKEKDYLLVYSYDNRMNSPEEIKAIKEYAASRGLRTLSPGFYHKWCDYNIDVDPIALLAYFKNASGVVTDTFHGSVMSLITGADFVAKTRESNHLKLANLLREYGVEDRIINDWKELAVTMEKPMDYEKIEEEIERRRNESMAHLHKMLNLADK